MSLLLGVRGADHKTQGHSFQENIRQQPGSYYNSNTSSHLSESSSQPIWRELPSADEILSRSSTAVHLVPLTSAASKTSSGLTEEKHLQDTLQRDSVRGEGFNPSKAEGHRQYSSNVQQNAKTTSTYRSLDTPILPLSHGSSPQSELLSNHNMSSFTFSAKSFQDFSKNGKSKSDEKLRRSDMEPISTHKNEKSWKLGASDPETKSSLQGSSDNTFFTQQRLNPESMTTQILENDTLKCLGAYKSTCSDASDAKHTFTEKKTPEVFVFGASVPGQRSSFKSSAPEQKFFQSSFARPCARSRTSKFKRSSTLPKGKGLASIGGSAIQQSASMFSREASPESLTGLGSAVESSPLDEAECSDAAVWEKDNRDERIDFEEDEVLQSHYRQEVKSGAGTQNGRRGLLDKDDQEKISKFEPNQEDYSFADPNAQENDSSHSQETQTVSNQPALSARFGSWWPFKVETDRRENWMVDDSSKTFQDQNISTQSGDTPNEPKTNFDRRELSDINPSTTPSKPSESNLQCSLDGFEEVAELSNLEKSDRKISRKFVVKEPAQNSSDGSNDSIWSFGGKDQKQPFVFGASQHREDLSGENLLQRSAMTAPDGDLQEGCQGLNPRSCTSMASEVNSSSTAFTSGMTFGTAVDKGPTSMNNHTCLQSPVFTTCPPVTLIRSNSDLLMKGVDFPSFTEPEKEGPTGEFSGPLSCSESSASESSPSRAEPCQASDKPFNQMPCFKFQGNIKDESRTSYATGKNKSGTVSRVRRHVRGVNRSRRPAQATSFKDMPTPMDVSPSMNDMESSSRATTSEQPCLNLSGSTSTDSAELLREPSNLQKMTHPASCSTRSNVDTDHSIPTLQAGKQVFENSSDWNDHSIFSTKRSGKWKRSGLDDGYNSLSQKAQGSTGHPEGGAMSTIDDQTLKDDTIIYEPIFTFGANSSHTSSNVLQNRFEPRLPKEKPTESFEELPADRVLVPDMPFSLDQNQHHQSKVGPVPTNLLASTDQNSLSGLSRPLSNQNHTYIKSSEDVAAANMDSAHHVLDGMGNTNAVKSAAAEQVCERWRLRGNQAYAIGDFPKAEEYYSRGASSVSPNETSQSCIRASMLCYSNRAATRMAVGRMREALADCKRAMVVDPGFLRVRLRAASCHLALGESKAAMDMFKDCLKYAKENSKSDPKILVEAMEGVKKTQQLDDYSDRALELLQQSTPMDSTSALRLVNEALSISPFSEPLHELKAQALLSLRRYDECLQFCEQTLPAAERNHGYAVCEKHQDSYIKEACESSKNAHLKLWRWRLSAKALYNLGKLEESLELLVKHDEVLTTCAVDKCTYPDSLSPLIANIRDQLRHKVAGNEAFQLGKHSEAVEHYTAALACNGDSRPFNAVCFCNRAAAWQALGHIADAIADCSRAIALDAVYPKALSRRATLHEMIRDYGQACNDLRRLIALLEDQINETSKGAGSTIAVQDLRQAKERLERSEEEMKKGHPIDHYLVLGVDFSCSANEIKKAYRKAALKHHPDKAGQFLARSETGEDGGLWNEMSDEVCRDAERLFKLIGEAYGILSDGTKRLRYDTDEENRKLRGKDGGSQVPSSSSDGYRPQYEKSSRRQQRDRWDAWQGFGPQHQRWQSGPDAAQPDTYGRRTTGSGDSAKAGKTTWNADFFWDKL